MVLNKSDIEYMLFNTRVLNQTEFQMTRKAHAKFLIDYAIGSYTLFQGNRDIIIHSGSDKQMTIYRNAKITLMNKDQGYLGFKCDKIDLVDYSKSLIMRSEFISKLKKS